MRTWKYLKRYTIFLILLCSVTSVNVMALILTGFLTVGEASRFGDMTMYVMTPLFIVLYILTLVDIVVWVKTPQSRVKWVVVTFLLTPLWYILWRWHVARTQRAA